MSNYVFNGKDNLDDDTTHPFAGITGTLVEQTAMTEAGYDGLIALNTTFNDLANTMTEQSNGQYTFTEQEVIDLYSPENFDFDATQKMIVGNRPVTEVNIKVELFPL
jgi:hypothetical protein